MSSNNQSNSTPKKTNSTNNEVEKIDLSQVEVEMIDLSQVYESLRYSEYSVENGVGELGDNGVEAGAHNLRVDLVSSIHQEEGRKKKKTKETVDSIAVADDGCGMDKETLWQCLVLGKSMRQPVNGKKGIGRFGVGMTLGGISLGRKVEVYSRTSHSKAFQYTYIDLDEVSEPDEEKRMKRIPEPIKKKVPAEYTEFFAGKSGTLIVISKCDRVEKGDAQEIKSTIANYLGRTYRKFIEGGLEIKFNGKKVYLHDPLYLAGPTQFDTKESVDPKATLIDTYTIPLQIIGEEEGKTADIKITLSLLPKEWRMTRGDGASKENKLRKVDQNEGVSILRAGREVLYDKVPYLFGKRGQAHYEEKDRFWGCEIAFPPELDDYFQIRYIKRGAEPVPELRDRIRMNTEEAIKTLRKIISADWDRNEFEQRKSRGEYDAAEAAMAKAEDSGVLKRTARGKNLTPEEEDSKIDGIVDEIISDAKDEEEAKAEREERKNQIKSKKVSLAPVSYPASVLFEPEYLMGSKIVIKINVRHPFYQKFVIPLCGNLEEDGAKASKNEMMARDAIYLLFSSYARATAEYESKEAVQLLENHLASIGTYLSSYTNAYNGDFSDEDE